MILTATTLADDTGLFLLFLQISDARRFIRELLHEIQYVHNVSIRICTINILKFSKIRKCIDMIFHLRNVKYLTDTMRIII